MLNRLIKVWPAVSGKKGRGRDNLYQQLGGGHWWFSVAFIFIGLSLVLGCSGPSQQVLTAQALTKMQAPDPNKDMQQQLMVQASQASLVNYKDYQVGTEDQLAVVILGQDKLTRELRVDGQGEIAMPMVGVVKVAGLTPREIEQRLKELYHPRYLINPQISVTVKDYCHQRVAVTGAVAKPGTLEIIGPRTLLEVLAQAGGFSGGPAGDVISVIRHQNAPDMAKTLKAGCSQPCATKTETMVINLRRLVSGQTPELNIPIRNGDVINVPFAGTAYVMGGVRRPGSIPVKENLTLSQAVAMSGGIDPMLGTNSITIMRFDEQGKPINLITNLSDIISRNDPDISLRDNDVVVVNESVFKKSLMLFKALNPVPTPSIPVY